jgi:hypothetical protein
VCADVAFPEKPFQAFNNANLLGNGTVRSIVWDGKQWQLNRRSPRCGHSGQRRAEEHGKVKARKIQELLPSHAKQEPNDRFRIRGAYARGLSRAH